MPLGLILGQPPRNKRGSGIAARHAHRFGKWVVFPVHVPPRHRDLALPLTRRAWVYYNASPSGDVYASRGVDVVHRDPFPLLHRRTHA